MIVAGLFLSLAVGYIFLVAVIALHQDRLLYLPVQGPVAAVAAPGLRAWPSQASFRGLQAEGVAPVRGTAIVFHGNAGHAGQGTFYVDALAPLGLRVILAEYPGYGPRPGPLGEESLVADAAQIIALVHELYGAPVVVIGESLGAGVAAAAVARQGEGVAGLLLITPWDRLEHVAMLHYPWLPVKWLLRDRYDSATHLAGFRRPVLVAVAGQDVTVPARFGQALHAALPEPKRLTVWPESGHDDWVAYADARWWREAVAFLLEESASKTP